jgi:peptidyl-tRNA hydrolase, PTH2 family
MINEAVQYIIVRKDLDMSQGKMSAQVAHASVATIAPECYDRIINKQHIQRYARARQTWFDGAFAKVVLKVNTKQQMMNLIEKLKERSMPFTIIRDACRTELTPEENDSTLTCIGLVPMMRNDIPDFLQKLRVYT